MYKSAIFSILILSCGCTTAQKNREFLGPLGFGYAPALKEYDAAFNLELKKHFAKLDVISKTPSVQGCITSTQEQKLKAETKLRENSILSFRGAQVPDFILLNGVLHNAATWEARDQTGVFYRSKDLN